MLLFQGSGGLVGGQVGFWQAASWEQASGRARNLCFSCFLSFSRIVLAQHTHSSFILRELQTKACATPGPGPGPAPLPAWPVSAQGQAQLGAGQLEAGQLGPGGSQRRAQNRSKYLAELQRRVVLTQQTHSSVTVGELQTKACAIPSPHPPLS